MPMQYVGKVGVKVVPDTRQWDATKRRIEHDDLRANVDLNVASGDLNKALVRVKQLRKEVAEMGGREKLDFDVKQARAHLDQVKDRIRQVRAEAERDVQLRVDAETAGLKRLQADLAEARKSASRAQRVDVDVSAAVAKLNTLQKARQDAVGKRSSAELDVDIERAKRKIADLKGRLKGVEAYSRRAAKIEVDTAAAQAKLRQYEELLKRTTSEKQAATIKVRIADAQAKLRVLEEQGARFRREAGKGVDLEVNIRKAEAALLRLKREREEAVSRGSVEKIDVDIKAASAKLRELQDRSAELHRSASKASRIEVDIASAKAKIHDLNQELKHAADDKVVKLKLDVEKRRAQEKLHDLTKKRDATIQAEADTAHARAQLALAARTRFVTFAVRVSGADKITAMLKAMSGLRTMERFRDGLLGLAENADTFIMKFAALGPALVTVGASFTRLVPMVVNLGAGLVKIVPAALNLVSVFAGLGVAVWSVKSAVQNLDQVVGVSHTQFTALKQRVEDFGNSLKKVAAQHFFDAIDPSAMNELADKVFPQVEEGVGKVSDALGHLAERLAVDLNKATTSSSLVPFFGNVSKAVTALSPAVSNVVVGILSLANIGSQRLPDMSAKASEASEKFRDWATDTDKVNAAMDRAKEQLGYAGQSVGNLVGVMRGLAKASMEASGVHGLQGLAEATGRLNDSINSMKGQDGLRRIFSAASETTRAFYNQLPPLEDELLALGRSAGQIGPAAGTAFGSLLSKLNEIMLSPAVAGGLEGFFKGVAVGISGIDAGGISERLNQIFGNFGKVAANMGPILNELIARFLDIAVTVSKVAVVVSSFLAEHPAVIKAIIGIAAVVGTVGTAMKVWGTVMSALGPVLGMLGVSTEGLGKRFLMMGGFMGVFTKLLMVAALAFIGLNAAGVPVTDMLANIETHVMDFVGSLPQMIGKVAQFAQSLANGIAAAAPQIAAKIGEIIPTVVQAIANGLPALISAGVTIINSLVQGVVQVLPTLLQAGVQILMALVQAIVTALPALLQAGVQIVTGLVQAIVENLPMLIEGAVQLVTTLLQLIVENLPTLIEAGVQILTTLVQAIVENLPMLLDTAVQLVTSLLQSLLDNLPQLIEAGVQMIITLVTGIVQMTPQLLTTAIELIPKLLGALLQVLPQLLKVGFEIPITIAKALWDNRGRFLDAGRQLMQAGAAALHEMGHLFLDAGRAIVDKIASGIRQFMSHPIQALKDGLGKLAGLLPHSPAKEGPFSGRGWGGWGEAIVSELARGIDATSRAPAEAMRDTMAGLASQLGLADLGYKQGRSYAQAIADGLSDGSAKVSSALGGLPLDLSNVSLSLAGASGGGVAGTTINQSFDTKVYRSGDDLWTAAPILYRQAEREARSVAR